MQGCEMGRRKRSTLLDTQIIYCGDCLDQLQNLPDASVDLIYIDPPFSHRLQSDGETSP